MRFHLVDRILELRPGHSIRAAKNLTLGEEYLADHFPSFPVMPGVLMLQTLAEAGAWLVRLSTDFRYSVITLKEAKGVKYGTFMEPGRQLLVTMELTEQAGGLASFKGKGEMDGAQTVTAKLTLSCRNLGDGNPALRPLDERIVSRLKDLCPVLRGELASPATAR
jgi:3-hydroxyacyl-[acyl-carrier-protein] dehydratase